MSIDLTLVGPGAVATSDLLKGIQRCGSEWLRVPVPKPKLFEVRNQRRVAPKTATIGEVDGMALLSWDGTDDGVAVIAVKGEGGEVVFTLACGATRSPTEYVLGVLAACALQGLWHVPIHDDNRFWGDAEVLDRGAVREMFGNAPGVVFGDTCASVVEAREKVAEARNALDD
jgi:hypothetical protein